MMKWLVLRYFASECTELPKNVTLFFLSIIVKSTPVFLVFSVGRNEHKFVICLRVKVFTCNILMQYSVVHLE